MRHDLSLQPDRIFVKFHGWVTGISDWCGNGKDLCSKMKWSRNDRFVWCQWLVYRLIPPIQLDCSQFRVIEKEKNGLTPSGQSSMNHFKYGHCAGTTGRGKHDPFHLFSLQEFWASSLKMGHKNSSGQRSFGRFKILKGPLVVTASIQSILRSAYSLAYFDPFLSQIILVE